MQFDEFSFISYADLIGDARLKPQIIRESLRYLFLGPDTTLSPAPVLSSAPANYATYITGGYKRGEVPFRFIQHGRYVVPDPWSSDVLSSVVSTTLSSQESLPYDVLPIAYCFRSPAGGPFAILSYAAAGGITQLVLLSEQIVVCDGSLDVARSVVISMESKLAESFTHYEKINQKRQDGGVVAVVDMLMNFGHQLINHLPALRRIVKSNLGGNVRELWISGTEFFPKGDAFLPEANCPVRRFPNRWDVHAAFSTTTLIPIKIGSNIFTNDLREMIINNAQSKYPFNAYPHQKWPLLCVTVRGTWRRCINLIEATQALYFSLSNEFPQLGILLDGWVWPDGDSISRVSRACEADRQLSNEIL